jgi:glycyl-radical enzyme activating protein
MTAHRPWPISRHCADCVPNDGVAAPAYPSSLQCVVPGKDRGQMAAPTDGSSDREHADTGLGQDCPSSVISQDATSQAHEAAGDDVGLVMNIQRFSTQDGPGVRTTVFLKGCSNSCAWCHNPESMGKRPELQFFPDRCIGRGRCAQVCPQQAHDLGPGGHHLNRERCQVCGQCVEECFAGALEVAGKLTGVDAVMEQVLADATYYRHSGGGITVSGGEPVIQRAFLARLLESCREHGVHTAIETAGNYPWAWLAEILPLVDLVMYDVKALDPRLHARCVGNDGTKTRDNLRRLGDHGTPLIIRTPLIGGFNDTLDEIAGIARLIADIPSLLYYELLPYHALGDGKRESLGMPPATRFATPSREEISALTAAARTYVEDVRP